MITERALQSQLCCRGEQAAEISAGAVESILQCCSSPWAPLDSLFAWTWGAPPMILGAAAQTLPQLSSGEFLGWYWNPCNSHGHTSGPGSVTWCFPLGLFLLSHSFNKAWWFLCWGWHASFVLCWEERSGHVTGILPRGSHRKLKDGSEFMKTSVETVTERQLCSSSWRAQWNQCFVMAQGNRKSVYGFPATKANNQTLNLKFRARKFFSSGRI